MNKLMCTSILSFGIAALAGCGGGNATPVTTSTSPSIPAAETAGGLTLPQGPKDNPADAYAGDAKAERTDNSRPTKNLAQFADAAAAREFVDARSKLEPKDVQVRDQLIALLGFWDDTSADSMKTSAHVRKEAAKILKKGAPFAASEQASLLSAVDTEDPNAGLLSLKALLEQKSNFAPETRTTLIGDLAVWNGSSKTYAHESAQVRKEVFEGVSRLLPLNGSEQSQLMDEVEQKDPFVAALGLELMKKQKKDLTGQTFSRIQALAKYSNGQTNAYQKESAKVRKLVAEIIK